MPIEIEKGICKMKDWRKIVEGAPVPGPSRPTPPERSPPTDDEDKTSSESSDLSSDSKDAVRDLLEPSGEEEVNLVKLCRNGEYSSKSSYFPRRSHHPPKEKALKNGNSKTSFKTLRLISGSRPALRRWKPQKMQGLGNGRTPSWPQGYQKPLGV